MTELDTVDIGSEECSKSAHCIGVHWLAHVALSGSMAAAQVITDCMTCVAGAGGLPCTTRNQPIRPCTSLHSVVVQVRKHSSMLERCRRGFRVPLAATASSSPLRLSTSRAISNPTPPSTAPASCHQHWRGRCHLQQPRFVTCALSSVMSGGMAPVVQQCH